MIESRTWLSRPRYWLLFGLAIRELLSFWTGHPYDLEVWLRNAYFVSQGQDPYSSFMPPVPGLSFAYLQEDMPGLGYLPFWPLILAGLYHLYSLFPVSRFLLYFLVKQPIVLADTALGFLIYRALRNWGASPEASLWSLRSWMFFPYAILISAVWGMFDALVASMFLLFLLSTHSVRRVTFLGAGIALKWFPLVFVPFLAIRERWPKNLGSALALAVPAGLTFLIFQVTGWTYVGVSAMSAYASHGGGAGMSYMNFFQAPWLAPFLQQIPISYFVIGYLWVPGIVVAALLSRRRFGSDPQGIVQAVLLITTIFYLTRYGVYEQYLLYLLPFFLIDLTLWHPERRPLFRFLLILATAYFLVNNDFLIRFLGPVSSSFVDVAFAADQTPDLGLLRVIGLYTMNVLMTITFVQLGLTFANPARGCRPWPFALLAWARAWIRPAASG